jgi:ABC-type multidrug transport system, ATPase component
LTGGEVIDLPGRLRGGVDPKRRDGLLEAFELDPGEKCRTYSKGNRQKVALVAALASDAELLILDEPTSGLDPLMERQRRPTPSRILGVCPQLARHPRSGTVGAHPMATRTGSKPAHREHTPQTCAT